MRGAELGWQLQTRAAVLFELELLRLLRFRWFQIFRSDLPCSRKAGPFLEAAKEHVQLDTHVGCLGQLLLMLMK